MDSAKSLAGSSQNDRLGPHSLRHLQGARVRHGHVLRHQVALRPGQEEGGEQARAARCQWQDRCRLHAAAAVRAALHLRPGHHAGHGPEPLMAGGAASAGRPQAVPSAATIPQLPTSV